MSIQSNFPNLKPSLLLDFANTKQLDNRVTFTRSTPAVYYDGRTTTMAEQNLLLQSQTFDVSPWTVANTSVTANATTAPDGTTTADRIFEDSANSAHAIYQALGTTSGSCTFSVYAKADTRSWLNINAYVAGVRNNWFDLTNGVTGTVASGCTATITSVGNGWYRCTVTTTGGSPTYFECWLATGNNVTTYAGDGTSGIYLWGAQFEARSSATAYTATTTQPITNYIPVLLTAGGNQPRFDCNPTTGESLGLLIEEARTNLQTYSSTGSGWVSYLSVTWISSSVVAPNGQIQGADVTFPSGSQMYSYAASFGSSGIAVTASAYMKYRSGASIVGIGVYDNTQGNRYVYFDLSNGTISSSDSGTSGTITSVGNGWYRCTNTKTVQNASGGMSFYASNGACNIYTWGAQLEVGAFATSYIATTSASATRTADNASMTGTNFSSWYNTAEATLFAEAANILDSSTDKRILEIARAATDSRQYDWRTNGSNISCLQLGNGADTTIAGIVTPKTFYKSAVSAIVGTGLYNIAANGVLGTSASITTMIAADTMFIGSHAGSGYYTNGWIKKIAYYPIRVTNAQLQALTS